MSQMTDVLTFDVTERAPMMPGDHFMDMAADRTKADVIDTRYVSNSHSARQLTANLSDGLTVSVNDGLWASTSPFKATYRGNDLYILSLRLAGNCLETVNRKSYRLGAYTCSMIHYAPGVAHVFQMGGAEPLVEVCAIFRAAFFMKRYGMSALEVASLLSPPRQRDSDPWLSQCTMTAGMESVVRELRSSSPLTKAWRLFAEAKTLELIFLYLQQLEDQTAERGESPVTYNHRQRLHVVRQYLGKHYMHSPRIGDLCRMSGLSRRKLTEGFKAEFGRTVYDHIQYLRMEEAKALLQNGVMDICQVSDQVGYGHQGNFTKAFKRSLGVSPRKYMAAQRVAHANQKVRSG